MSNSTIDTIFNEPTAFERSSIYTRKMEILRRGLNNVQGKNVKSGTGTQFLNNLPTPGTSLEPEDARIEADQARQAAEAAAAVANGSTDQPMGGADGEGGDEDNNDDDGEFIPPEDRPPSEEQIEAV